MIVTINQVHEASDTVFNVDASEIGFGAKDWPLYLETDLGTGHPCYCDRYDQETNVHKYVQRFGRIEIWVHPY